MPPPRSIQVDRESEPIPVYSGDPVGRLSQEASIEDDGRTVSGFIDGHVSDVIRLLQSEGVSVSVDPETTDLPAIARWVDVPVVKALRDLAAQIPESIVSQRSEGVYFVGKPTDLDLSVRLFHVPGEGAEEIGDLLRQAGSKDATVSTAKDAVIVRDTVDGIERIERAFRAVTKIRGQWVVEVRFVEITRRGASRLGVDWNLVGSVAINASRADGWGWLAAADLTGLLEASENFSDVDLVEVAHLHCVEGEDAELQSGSTVRIPRPVFSEDGRVVSEDFEEVDVGTLLTVQLTSAQHGLVHVHYRPELSAITGFRGDLPEVSRRRLEGSAYCRPGDAIVVGGLSSWSDRRERTGLPGTARFAPIGGRKVIDQGQSRLFIVLRLLPSHGSPDAEGASAVRTPPASASLAN